MIDIKDFVNKLNKIQNELNDTLNEYKGNNVTHYSDPREEVLAKNYIFYRASKEEQKIVKSLTENNLLYLIDENEFQNIIVQNINANNELVFILQENLKNDNSLDYNDFEERNEAVTKVLESIINLKKNTESNITIVSTDLTALQCLLDVLPTYKEKIISNVIRAKKYIAEESQNESKLNSMLKKKEIELSEIKACLTNEKVKQQEKYINFDQEKHIATNAPRLNSGISSKEVDIDKDYFVQIAKEYSDNEKEQKKFIQNIIKIFHPDKTHEYNTSTYLTQELIKAKDSISLSKN